MVMKPICLPNNVVEGNIVLSLYRKYILLSYHARHTNSLKKSNNQFQRKQIESLCVY